MGPKRHRNIDSTFVVAEDAPLFQVVPSFLLVIIYLWKAIQWDVQYNEGGYTIQIHNQPLYIATQDVKA